MIKYVLPLTFFPSSLVYFSPPIRRMANSPQEDTNDLANQPNALIIGRYLLTTYTASQTFRGCCHDY